MSQIEQLRKDVEETADILRDNAIKAITRGENLENLHGRTEVLADQAQIFQKTTRKIHKKQKKKSKKLRWILIGVSASLAVIIIILLAIILTIKPWEQTN